MLSLAEIAIYGAVVFSGGVAAGVLFGSGTRPNPNDARKWRQVHALEAIARAAEEQLRIETARHDAARTDAMARIGGRAQ